MLANTARAGRAAASRLWTRGLAAGGPSESADVVIAGGGIMGLSIAFQLKRREPDMKVIVLEQAPSLGAGSSGYSTGFQRAFYSFDNTMQLALDGINAYKNWKEFLGDPDAKAYFTQTDALWMLGKSKAENETMKARLAAYGVESHLLDEAGLKERFPLMNPEPFPKFDENFEIVEQNLGELSALLEVGCGHLDSSFCLEDMDKAARRHGADVRMKQKVEAFIEESGVVKGVKMADGSSIHAGFTVNAAGPWFNKLNDTVGVKLSTTALPTRIQVGHKYIPDEYCDLPFTADTWGPSGIYFMPRRANNQLVFGSVDHRFEAEVVDPDDYNQNLDPDFKQEYLNALFHRLPGLDTSGEIVGFSSMYTVNQDDVHPMIGETERRGLWACNGFSGHGFKLAPAVGSLVAQQITGKKLDGMLGETNIPLDFLGPNRKPLIQTSNWDEKTHFA